LFYDNPVDTFQAIGEFVHATHSNEAACCPTLACSRR
jgi:hypothetical protein